jgi:hypothetical protein
MDPAQQLRNKSRILTQISHLILLMEARSPRATNPERKPMLIKIARVLPVLVALLPATLRPQSNPPAASSCTVSITGGAGVTNGSYPCFPKAVYDPTKHLLTFTLALDTPGSGSEVQLSVTLTAPQIVPQAATFTLGTGKVMGGVTLKEKAGTTVPVWNTKSQSQSTVELDDLGAATPAQDQQIYLNPQGSISATLEPQTDTGANGTVDLNLSFPSTLDE